MQINDICERQAASLCVISFSCVSGHVLLQRSITKLTSERIVAGR